MSGGACCGANANPETIFPVSGDWVLTLPNGAEMRFFEEGQARQAAAVYPGVLVGPDGSTEAPTTEAPADGSTTEAPADGSTTEAPADGSTTEAPADGSTEAPTTEADPMAALAEAPTKTPRKSTKST